jgi:hypothetical protein
MQPICVDKIFLKNITSTSLAPTSFWGGSGVASLTHK